MPPIVLRTSRLSMEPPRLEDFEESAAMWAEASVTRHISGKPRTRSESWTSLLRRAGCWSLLGFGYWAVREIGSGRYVGEVGFQDPRRDIVPNLDGIPEIGWVLAPWAQGTGFATEATLAAVGWADDQFTQGRMLWARTLCLIDEANRPSLRVAEKAGYRFWQAGRLGDQAPHILVRDRPG